MKEYIKTSIKKIKQAIDNNKLVVFVGAGVSANSKCPSWYELVEKFANELGISKEKINNCSTEDFLKIPQYYYIERGEKEYFDIINDVFNNTNYNYKPNELDKLIFELKPSTIVTTNFDDLLEKTIEMYGQYYTVVKQDRDLPYSPNDKLVIKMHGDVKLKNIILKEEDYLNYSNKFPLIENYLKGLFSTKTILFVGYSANDIDFKLMFNWVKEQLKGHFQPAYILETEKKQDRMEFNYYKDRGINILYYTEVEEEVSNFLGTQFESSLEDIRGKHLEKFLRYIKDYKVEDTIINRIYNQLKIFEGLNAIMPEDIYNQLKNELEGISLNGNNIVIPDYNFSDKIKKILYNKNNRNEEDELEKIISDKNIVKIYELLTKASIQTIEIYNSDNAQETKVINLEDYIKVDNSLEDDEYEKLLQQFEFMELKNRLDYYLLDSPIENNEQLYLRKAYYLYRIGESIKAYVTLKKVSVHCYSSKKYLYWYIALFNMKHLYVKIRTENCSQPQYDKILDEAKKIDLDKEVMTLPINIQNSIKNISKIISIDLFNEKIQKLQELLIKIKEDKHLLERGGSVYNQNIYELYINIKNLKNYIEKNYLMISHYNNIYKIFSVFIESIIVSFSIGNKNNKTMFWKYYSKINEFNKFDINIILNYSTYKELNRYINDNNIEQLKVNAEEIEYLIKVFGNISKLSIRDISNIDYILENIITILSYCNITKDNFKDIVQYFTILLEKNALQMVILENINKFINIIYEKNNELIDGEALESFFEKYIMNFNCNKLNGFEIESAKRTNLLKNIFYICRKQEITLDKNRREVLINEVKIFIDNYFNSLISDVYERGHYYLHENLLSLICIIYNEFFEETKEIIEKGFIKSISYFKQLTQYHIYLKIQYYGFMSDILKMTEEEKKQFTKEVNSAYKTRLEIEKNGGYSSNDFSEMYLSMLLSLILEKKIDYNLVKDECYDILENSNKFKFFIDTNNFDYDDFNINWILEVSDEYVEALTKDKSIANKMKKAILDKLQEDNVNKKLKKKILIILKNAL